ncbi:MAG: MFS transporter [Clostridiales bacterium 36_14]|nr:MAG: MFS transporter [Clostridiales bacterium 36_14]
METSKSKKVIAAGILVMSMTMACNSALAPILAEVGKYFPDSSDAAIQIVLTIINLITLPMMIIEPFFEKVITKRDIAIIGTALMLVGALVPQVLNTELWMLYIASGIIGIGLSFVVVTSSSLISDYFSGIDKSRIMGFQSIFVSIGGTTGYLVFLITVPIILIILFTVPRGEVIVPEKTEEQSGGISGSMVYFGFLCLITGIFVATFNTNIAMYIDAKHIGDANTAGTVSGIMQVVGIIGGLLLGTVVKTFKRFTIGGSILVMAAGTACVALSTNFAVICVGAFLVGIGFAIRNPGAVTFGANMVPAAQASLAIAIISATYNVGNFLSAFIINPLANMFSTDISMRFLVAAIGLAIVGILACVKAPVTDEQALDAQ